MKSLKKLAVIAALSSAMNVGATNSKEVQYGPVSYNGGEIDKIELVNGHILVRSDARIPGQDVPYMYTSTNVQDYASVAFAQGGATNVNQYVHAGNGKIYMTFNHADGVYTTQIGDKFGPGVVEVDIINPQTKEITKHAIREVTDENDPIAKAMLDASNSGSSVAVLGSDAYYYKNENGKFILYKNGEFCQNDFLGGTGFHANASEVEQMMFLDAKADGSQKLLYVLAKCKDSKKRIYTADGDINGQEADSISISDGKLVIKSGNEVAVHDPINAQKTTVVDGSTSTLPADVKSVVVSGKNIYYATAKKLGVKTIGE